MKKYKWIVIVVNLILLLLYFYYSISEKEALLKNGKLALLELAPVDPRSLMQGDYMALRYKISDNLEWEKMPKRGYCVIKIDHNGVATKIRFQEDPTPLHPGENLIKYNSSNRWNVNIGAESFFFEEGQSKKYEKAKYGGTKIDENGNSLLIGLYDENLKQIQ